MRTKIIQKIRFKNLARILEDFDNLKGTLELFATSEQAVLLINYEYALVMNFVVKASQFLFRFSVLRRNTQTNDHNFSDFFVSTFGSLILSIQFHHANFVQAFNIRLRQLCFNVVPLNVTSVRMLIQFYVNNLKFWSVTSIQLKPARCT